MPDSVMIAKERKALMKLMDQGEFKIPKREVDENVIIATWNIQHFGARHTARALRYAADIVERFDIVALQEVKTSLKGLVRLKALLPGAYDLIVTDPSGNNERFAFLYDSRTVQPTGLACEVSFPLEKITHSAFQLHRMPHCVSFRAGRFDFIVVNVHIFQSDTVFREKEIDDLVKFIVKRSKTARTKVFDRDFFIVGDFNIEQAGDRFFRALAANAFHVPPEMDNLKTNFSRTKTFDKISWVERPSFNFSGKCNVLPFGRALFRDQHPPGGKKQISDHLPLWAEFRVNRLTQELDQIIATGRR